MPTIHNYNPDPVVLDRIAGALTCISQVIAVGTMIEIRLAAILAAIAGSDVVSTITLLDRLRTVQSKEDAVMAVAKEKLGNEDYAVLAAASLAVKGHRARRNSFCHDVWASAADFPDAAFSIPAKQLAMSNAQFSATDPQSFAAAVAMLEVDVPDGNVYRAADFEKVAAEASEAASVMHLAHYYADWCRRATRGGPAVAPAKAELLDALNAHPSFRGPYERKRR